MRRHIIGLIALALLLTGVTAWLAPPLAAYPQLELICSRLGAIFAVWWLAYPDLNRLPAWLLVAAPVLIIVLARWPRYFLLLLPALVVLAILKPRLGGGKRRG